MRRKRIGLSTQHRVEENQSSSSKENGELNLSSQFRFWSVAGFSTYKCMMPLGDPRKMLG